MIHCKQKVAAMDKDALQKHRRHQNVYHVYERRRTPKDRRKISDAEESKYFKDKASGTELLMLSDFANAKTHQLQWEPSHQARYL
ncbi:hypothetical protein Hypma_004151 [Hypsizygus marmoreus]|uniref:Uncharacterized protein n=1 Tax=Hypsizygus marmoreus TaxID=39966 RepID=A0A369J4I2_HYPMA|nr:hypothetical protein Hypma_004151 [Hypsizygus marmoreus]